MIPVYLKTAGTAEPADLFHYLVASNGVFLVKDTGLYRAVTEMPGVAGLERLKASLVLRVPKIPRDIVERIYGFFDYAWRNWNGEAVAFVYYAAGSGEFQADVPPQRLYRYRSLHGWRTERRVEYDFHPRPPGFLKLCDFHSHADMPAFFSATDDYDDREDGLRVVMGRMNRVVPDVRASFVAAGTRFTLGVEEVMEGFSHPAPVPAEWTRRLVCLNSEAARGGAHRRA